MLAINNKVISIIIRFHNEALYLPTVFKALRQQVIDASIELIAVNNKSTDDSRAIAEYFSDIVLDIDHYEPGKALNMAIGKSSGSVIVVLSAHTLPGNNHWLRKLISPLLKPMHDRTLIATYGAQIYPFYSQFLDKRDLDIFNFSSNRKEYSDSDFWNANSAFKRKIWELNKFSEKVYELEDHFWTKEILSKGEGYVFFNQDAYVYHYGHNERIDRKYPNISSTHYQDKIHEAKELLTSSSRWEDVMQASLICNTVSNGLITDEIIELLGFHLLRHWDFDVRWRIAQTLGNIPNAKSIFYLTKALKDNSFYPRNEAAWSLRKLLPDSLELVTNKFNTASGEEKLYAAFVMGSSDDFSSQKKSCHCLKTLLNSKNHDDVLTSLYIIGEITSNIYIRDTIVDIMNILHENSRPDKVIAVSIWCLGRIYESCKYDFPISLLLYLCKNHQNYLVRYEAINAIARYLGTDFSVSIVEEIHSCFYLEQDNRVKYAISQLFQVLCGKEYLSDNLLQSLKTGNNDYGVDFEIQMAVNSCIKTEV